MSKKLPGLTRRAPSIDAGPQPETTGAQSRKTAKARGKSRGKTRTKGAEAGGTSRARVTQASAREGSRQIAAEVLDPIGDDEDARWRVAKAREIVRWRTNWAMASGLVPIPVIDVVAIVGVQLTMLRELSAHYGVPFQRNLVKSLVMALIGGILPYVVGVGLAGSVAKSVPVLGWGIGLATVSVLAGAMTHATGVVFIQHFETGGTFLDFDPIATRAYFRREFEKAKAQQRAR